jgi:hypothetical protein
VAGKARSVLRGLFWVLVVVAGVAALVIVNSLGGEPALLSRVPELQERASKALAEPLSLSPGSIAVRTSRGEEVVIRGPAPAYVFGSRTRASELLDLLRARVAADRTGSGPMAGDTGALVCMTMVTLVTAGEPQAVTPMKELLTDPDEEVRKAACLSLIRLAERDADLQPAVSKIVFSREAIDALRAEGATIPDWVQVAP